MARAALNRLHWQQVVGQTRLRTQLADSLRASRAAHASLFAGPSGVGKAAVALEYAALLLCERDGLAPCGECPQCHATARLEHPDLHLIFPLPSTAKKAGERENGIGSSTDEDPSIAVAERVTQLTAALARDPYTPVVLPKGKRQKDDPKTKNEPQSIRIEQIRSVLRWAALKPFSAPRKVFLIFQADTMNHAAQNALLKALEEPSPEAYFLLIAENEPLLLPTIRSRCQGLRLAPLPRDEIRAALIAGGISPERADAAAALCGGRLVRAREMAGSDLPKLQEHVIAYLRAAAKCDPAMIMDTTSKLMDMGDQPGETALEMLGLFLRDVSISRAGNEAATILTFAEFTEPMARLLNSYPAADFETAARLVDQSANYLTRGYTQDLVMYALAIRLHAALGPLVPTKPKPQVRHA